MFTTYEEAAAALEHTLLDPALTSAAVREGLELGRRLRVAAVVVRPCDIELAVRALDGSEVRPASVAGFPHGTQNTATKLYELRDLLRRGAREIGMVMAIPRLVSREFQHVQTELLQAADECRKQGAALKAILETSYLTDELKIVACRTAERAGVDFVETSTGFGPAGYTFEDIRLMRKHVAEPIGVKVAGVTTLDDLLGVSEAGAARAGTSETAVILDEWKARLAAASVE